MITQEPSFVRTLSVSQKNQVLVIETGCNVIRRNKDQLVTGPCQLPCVFYDLGLRTTVNAGLKHMCAPPVVQLKKY